MTQVTTFVLVGQSISALLLVLVFIVVESRVVNHTPRAPHKIKETDRHARDDQYDQHDRAGEHLT